MAEHGLRSTPPDSLSAPTLCMCGHHRREHHSNGNQCSGTLYKAVFMGDNATPCPCPKFRPAVSA